MFSPQEIADKIRQKAFEEPVSVLIWGPGDPGIDASAEEKRLYEKRCKIRDELKRRFEKAFIYFSEDPEMDTLATGLIGQLLKQALQAYSSNIVIMLDLARGVDLELDHFVPKYPWFREKVHLFLPARYLPSTGLINEVIKLIPDNQVVGFTDSEFDSCTVATEKSVNAVYSIAMAKILERGGV